MKSFINSSYYELVTRNGTFQIVAFRVTYAANGRPTAIIELATGISEKTQMIQTGHLRRGAFGYIYAYNSYGPYMPTGGFKLFQGYIFDFGPSSFQFGALGIQVLMTGVLSDLASGTLQTGALIPSSYRDDRVPFMDSWGGDKPAAGRIDPVEAFKFGLLRPMKDSMVKICNGEGAIEDSVSLELSTIGVVADANNRCASLIRSFSGDEAAAPIAPFQASGFTTFTSSSTGVGPGEGLVFRTQTKNGVDMTESFVSELVENLNSLQTTNLEFATFYTRLEHFGQILSYSFVELPNRIWVVPFLPFFRSADAYAITSDSYSIISQSMRNDDSLVKYRGAFLVAPSDSEVESSLADKLVIGRYTSPLISDGQVLVAPAPPMFAVSSSESFSDNNPNNARSMNGDLPDLLGDEYAKLAAWTATYAHRRVSVVSPFVRTDVAPLTPVKVYMPASSEISAAVDTSAIYGVVQAVTIAVDARSKSASTQIEIGFARSYAQQTQEINAGYKGHPIFNHNWRGCSLTSSSER